MSNAPEAESRNDPFPFTFTHTDHTMSQNYANHRRFVPGYHYVLTAILLGTIVGSVVNLVGPSADGLYSASLITALSVAMLMTALYARIFATKVQDRVIRAEERTRSLELTGSALDPGLTMRQIVGLRFASDEEFPALAASAAKNGTSEADIKKAIKNWRADDARC
ncbi:MAG: hypothetical protein ACI84D_002253 [Thalassolituus oleivorans]|jgi:hypothetical protein